MSRRKSARLPYNLPIVKNNWFHNQGFANDVTFMFIFNRMCEIYMNLIKLEDVPDTIDIPSIFYGLLTSGNVCYFQDMILGDLCLQGTPSGQVDIYNYPNAYYIHTASGYNNHLAVSKFSTPRTGVVIYASYLRIAPLLGIQMYAYRLWDLIRTMDVNVHNQKTPKIIHGTPQLQLSIQNQLEQYDGNVPVIIQDKEVGLSDKANIVYDVTAPYVTDKLWVHYVNIWNDFLTWCGVENATNQKRERLVEDEVNANYGNVEMERHTYYSNVKRGFKEVNKLFDRDIKVSFNSDLASMLNVNYDGGYDLYGDLHNEDAGMGAVFGRGVPTESDTGSGKVDI